MSFTDNFLKELEKRKKKIDNSIVISPYSSESGKETKKATQSSDSFTDSFLSELGRLAEKNRTTYEIPVFNEKEEEEEDDIAPVKNSNSKLGKIAAGLADELGVEKKSDGKESPSKKEEEKSKKRTWFEKGAFSDGYDFGDITKTILGTGRDIREDLTSGLLGIVEGTVDAGATLVGGAGKLFGADKFADRMKGFVQKDLINEDKLAKNMAYNTASISDRILVGRDAEDESVLGEKSDSLVQSAGQLAGQMGLQALHVPWYVTSGATSFGGEAEQAFNDGANYGEAVGSALISAGSEILTEKLTGGSGLGEKGLINVDAFTKGIANKTVKTMLDFGIDVLGEGAEEVMSSVFSRLGTKLYKEESIGELLFSEEAIDEYLEGFIGGAVLGGGMNVGKVSSSVKNKTDYRSGLTSNEEAVVNREVEKRIEEAEKGGNTLSKKDKATIREQVEKDLDKGYISTDTIEEVLGGETYKSYQDTVKSEDALKSEYDELKKVKTNDATLEQNDRYNELKKKLSELETTSERSFLESKYKNEAYEVARGSRLEESYNERARRGEKFTADLSKYNKKQQTVIQKAIDSGILNNTNRSHEFVDLVAKIAADKGVEFDFFNNQKLKESSFAVDGATVNGYFDPKTKTVGINMNSAKALNTVVGHEITHVLEGTKLYDELASAITEYAKSKGDYQARYDALSKLYDAKDLDSELTADLVGDYLFTDADFVNNLSVNHRNVFQKIYDEIKYLYKVATAGTKEARELEKVKRAFEEAYRAQGEAAEQSGTKLSIAKTSKMPYNDQLQQIEKGQMNGSNSLYVGTSENLSKAGFSNAPFAMNQSDYRKSRRETAKNSKYSSHAVPYDFFENLPDHLNNAPMLVDNGDKVTVITPYATKDTKGNDSYVIAGVWQNQQMESDTVNLVKSVYPWDDFADRIKRYAEAGSLVVTNKNKVEQMLTTIGIQPAEVSRLLNLAKDSISQKENVVNRKFSLSEAVEETNDLMALHNLKGAELLKSLELGGLPMPSIAIIKAEANHDQYGEISLILPKEAIDPKANKDNKIYGADAWTPTYPKIEFKPNEAVEKKISDKYYELHRKYGSEDARPLYKYTYDLERVLNNYGGEAAMLEDLYNSTNLMRAYLLDTGKGKVETIQKEVRTELSDAEVEMNEFFINELGADVVDGVMARGADSPSEHRIKYWKEHGDKIKEAYSKLLSEEYGFTAEQIENVLLGMKTYNYLKFIRDAHLYRINGRVTTKTEADNEATENAIKEAAGEGYKAWVDSLFKGIEEKSGIRNNVDYFTNSGNRRKWEALHWENTLENVVRVMKQQNQTGADAIFGAHQIFATAAKNYGSIDEVKADSHRLYKMSEEEYEAIKDSYSQRMLDIANRIMDKGERNQFIALDNAMECIVDAVRKSKTKAGIYKEMKQYRQLNVTEQDVEDIVSLVTDISNMPTGYFESKPMRAVGFDEVGVFVIPNNADVKLKQELLNRGYAIAEYDPDVEGSRQKVVNSFEQYKFSLSDVGAAPQTYGNYNVYGKDIAYEGAAEDVAPIRDDVASAEGEILPDGYAPMTEEDAAMIENEALDSITDADAPPEVDTPYDVQRDTGTIEDKPLKKISEKASEYLGLNRNEKATLEGIVQNYSQNESLDRDYLFSQIRDNFSVREEIVPNEDVRQMKKDIKSMNLFVSDEVKSDFGKSKEDGYTKFLRSNFGKLRIVKDAANGIEVDSAYEELSSLYPSYFPEDIINPADRLRTIADVASMSSEDVFPIEVSEAEIQEVADMVYIGVSEYMNEARLNAAEASVAPHSDVDAPTAIDEAGKMLEQEKAALLEEYESKKAEIQKIVDDKDGFIKKRADELYWELSGLKKGVRASKELGYLLDYGYPWSALKTALVNTKLHPDSRVNEDSVIESIVREALNGEYENLAYEIDDLDIEYKEKLEKLEADAKIENKVLSIREMYDQKKQNYRDSLAALEAGKEKSLASFNEAIGKKLDEYNALKNKNTKRANTLLQQIENLRLRRDNVQGDYTNRIAKQQVRLENFESKDFSEFENKVLAVRRKDIYGKIIEEAKAQYEAQGLDLDEVLEKAKDLSTFSTVDNTPQRVMEKSLGYKEGKILSDITVNKVAQNETEGIKWLNTITDKKNGLLAQLVKQYGIKPESKESAAAQMYAEGFFVDTNGDVIKYGDAELAKDFPNEEVRQNIIGLARDQRVRQFYDETLDKINESRARNAYPEIQKLENYFLHFRAMEDTFSRLGLPFNPNDIKAKDLPTDLNGVTADLKPGQPYFASAKHREGKRTSFDLLGGLEKYATSAKNQIYHIDDIQTLRAIRNYIADTYGQAKGLSDLDALTEEEVQERIKEVYGSHLSTFAKFLNEEANVLAGKTALIDRGFEGIFGRRAMTFMDTVNRQVGSNMVGYNVSSALTNLVAPVQAFAKTNKADFIKGFAQTVSNKIGGIFGKGDSFTDESPVVIRRKGAGQYYRTAWQKLSDPGYALMGAVDSFSTELIARAKYNELTRKGMDSETAHVETDKWVSRLMGDRSLGQMPQLYNSKMLGLVTKFQLEVRNQLDSQFYDTIQEAKASTEDIENGLHRNAKRAAKITSTFFTLAVGQHLFGKAFESIAGYNPAFDIISALIKTLGLDDEEDSEDTFLDNIEQGFFELMGDMPYTSILEGGRIPISSALPIEELYKGKDQYGNEKSRWETVLEALPYYLSPGGYGQAKKTAQGLGMFDDELPISGSYTDSGKLRFPVEDNFLNRVQAGIFGQYASENARDYFDNERKALDEKQIQEFIDSGISIQDYWNYREGLSGLKTLNEKADYINGLDLPIEVKNLLINNLSGRKDPIDLSGMDGYADFNEYDFAQKNPEKYEWLKNNGITVEQYEGFDKETKEEYDFAYKSPEKYVVAKSVGGYNSYKTYTSDLYDIKADKDEDGKTISGSRKEKVIDYINNLDADYGEKIILFKSEYPSDDTYNYEIIDYLNGRDDISYEDMVTILKELGFTVKGDTVYWD